MNIRKNDGQIIGFYNWWSVPWQAGSVPEDNKRYWICPLLNYTFQVSLSMFEAQPAASSIVIKPITICKHQTPILSRSLLGQAAQHLQKIDFVCSSIMVLKVYHCKIHTFLTSCSLVQVSAELFLIAFNILERSCQPWACVRANTEILFRPWVQCRLAWNFANHGTSTM